MVNNIFFIVCSVLSPPHFSLCFSTPFLTDLGKVKVVFQNGIVKIEEVVPVQPRFSQVKHYFF